MLDYEVFKSIVKDKFIGYLPEKYRDADIEIFPARKVNREVDSLTVRMRNSSQMVPAIYVNDMYRSYQQCGDLETVLKQMAKKYAEALAHVDDYQADINIEHFKDNVVMCLVNTEQNRELLADVPNRKFHDLSVIYRWVVGQFDDGVGHIMVSNELAELAGMTEEELFRCAAENTKRINPICIESMSDMFRKMLGCDIPKEITDEINSMDNQLWIISNSSGINGAVSMLYEENLHQLAERLGDNLYILPSSIHEVIAVPAENAKDDLDYLKEMVYTANMDAVLPEERLSNNVYYYDKDLRKLTMATDVRDKNLNGEPLNLIKTEERPEIGEERGGR